MSEHLPLTPEILVPRLGDSLLEKGLVNQHQLEEALVLQKKMKQEGRPPLLLGNLLIQMGIITREKLDEVITEQVLQLREALQKYNQQLEQRVKERTIELEQALNKLSELNRLKTNFISNVSHELRTPLTHIKGYNELLITSSLGPLTDEQTEALLVLRRASERLEQLIESLIMFSTSEHGEFSLQIALLKPYPICEKAIQRLRGKLSTSNSANIHLNCPTNLPHIEGDEEKLCWAVLQLLDNAVKFTPTGGEVSLECKQEDHYIRFSVTDTGIGIPKEKVPELFEPFHQLDGSATRRYGGTGLGLALVKKIIEAHGSKIELCTQPGKGSCFSFCLLVKQNPVLD